MGRPIGSRKIDVEDLKRIVEMTKEGNNRSDIAEDVGVSKRAVWRYQKQFDLI